MLEVTIQKNLLELRDVQLHIEDSGGDGRPVVLIHGWPLSGKSWKNQVLPLALAGYRVITYDRRGFGESGKPKTGYSYDTLSDDLSELIEKLNLYDITLVGFSMGGGEVARYIARHGEDRLKSIVFAAAVTPMMMKTADNPEGPLASAQVLAMTEELAADADTFYDKFIKNFFSASADGHLLVSEEQKQEALHLCKQADHLATLETLQSFAVSDFREDLKKVTVPTLVIHGDADGIVPFEGSGHRTHEAVTHSELHVVKGGPHGINVSHVKEFNEALFAFLAK